MSEEITADLERHKQEFVQLQNAILNKEKELEQFRVERERRFGKIQLLEEMIKKQQDKLVEKKD